MMYIKENISKKIPLLYVCRQKMKKTSTFISFPIPTTKLGSEVSKSPLASTPLRNADQI